MYESMNLESGDKRLLHALSLSDLMHSCCFLGEQKYIALCCHQIFTPSLPLFNCPSGSLEHHEYHYSAFHTLSGITLYFSHPQSYYPLLFTPAVILPSTFHTYLGSSTDTPRNSLLFSPLQGYNSF